VDQLSIIPRLRAVPRHPLAELHVLVVGINYAPEPTGIAPYTTGMAEHLGELAGSVTVLTGVPHYPSWKLTDGYRWALRRREVTRLDNENGLLIRRLRHYVPSKQTALTRAGYEATFLLNAWSTRVRNRPDLVVAVTPSLGGAVAGARLARRHGSRLLVVVQDLMAAAASQSGIRGGSRASRATAALERYALQRADRVAVVSDSFRAELANYGVDPERISLLRNWTHISPAPASRASARGALGWPVEPFTVVHTGNIGLKQDLGNLVEAARLCSADHSMRFVIVGDGSQRGPVQAFAGGLSNLEFVDSLDDAAYPLALAAADVLVVNERPSVGDMSLPSKLTSYLSAGRPIVAAVSPDGATAHELERTGGAAEVVPAGYPLALAKSLRWLRDDPERRIEMATLGEDYAALALGKDAAMGQLESIVEQTLLDTGSVRNHGKA
jgi:glycosyltransferase involved in cell wall biosynthesis